MATESRFTVDEGVVRKMLRVNPELRRGRTTLQVKRALETGETVGGSETDEPTGVTRADGADLRETVDFFVSGKADKLRSTLAGIDARRRQLEAEEQRARAEMAEQVVAFIALLDDGAVAVHGKRALGNHADFLARVGLTPAGILDRVRNE